MRRHMAFKLQVKAGDLRNVQLQSHDLKDWVIGPTNLIITLVRKLCSLCTKTSVLIEAAQFLHQSVKIHKI